MKVLRLFLFCMLSLPAFGQESPEELPRDSAGAELNLGSRITGNKELPKILYIVPWATPPGPGQVDPLVPHSGNVFQRIYAPVERVELQRRLRYYANDLDATD